MNLNPEIMMELVKRVTPEGAALLLAIGNTPQDQHHYPMMTWTNPAAREGAEELAQELHKVLDDHLERDPAQPGIRIRVLAAALAAKKHLEAKPPTGWHLPKYGDKVRIIKAFNAFDEFKVGEIKTVRGFSTFLPEGVDGTVRDAWGKGTEPALMIGKEDPDEPTWLFPVSYLEPATTET